MLEYRVSVKGNAEMGNSFEDVPYIYSRALLKSVSKYFASLIDVHERGRQDEPLYQNQNSSYTGRKPRERMNPYINIKLV